jgi:hypothetical protein
MLLPTSLVRVYVHKITYDGISLLGWSVTGTCKQVHSVGENIRYLLVANCGETVSQFSFVDLVVALVRFREVSMQSIEKYGDANCFWNRDTP